MLTHSPDILLDNGKIHKSELQRGWRIATYLLGTMLLNLLACTAEYRQNRGKDAKLNLHPHQPSIRLTLLATLPATQRDATVEPYHR